ncbi:MAG: YhjD/YihY/BrkB family envelope integrity protein, partial [Anaerolineales bacterium]
LPETGGRWKDAWRGGVLASLLYNTGKFLIGYYLGVSGVGSIYGTAGTIMLLLLWTYYSIQILLMGAIFAKVFSQLGIEHTSTP